MVHLLHVVQIFQHVDEAHQLGRGLGIQLRFGGRDHGHFGALGLEAGGFQTVQHGAEVVRGGVHLDGAIFFGHHVVGTRFQGGVHQGIFIGAHEGQYTLLGEQVGHGAIGTQVAAALAEGVTHFGHGAVAVVGQALHHDGGAGRAVTFVDDGFELLAVTTAGPTGDGTVDGVTGHVAGQGRRHRRTQARVVGRVGITETRGGGDFADQLGEDLAALGVLRRLAVFDVGPFTVTCHRDSPLFFKFQ